MTHIKIKNYGITNIEWLIKQFDGKPATSDTINELKSEIIHTYKNNPYVGYCVSDTNIMIVDYNNETNCEIEYKTK